MQREVLAILGSILLVSLISLVGAFTLVFQRLRGHHILLLLVAFAAGALLGDAFVHILPEAVAERGGWSLELSALVLGGFLAFFVLETVLRWGHAHGESGHEGHAAEPGAASEAAATVPHVKPYAWMNLIGDGMHNFIDGALIATTYYVSLPLGFATTIAVAAHEIPQELGDFAVLLKAGLKPGRALLLNLLSAFVAFLGGLLVMVLHFDSGALERIALPLTAGGFLYIAAADLVPELHHHSQARYVPLVMAGLLAGLGLMFLLLRLEG